MGMGVIGKNKASEVGSYFRRNVWGWRPLWQYVEIVHSDLAAKVEHAQTNDGDGLNAEDSRELAGRLREDLEFGVADRYLTARNAYLSELPRDTCDLCNGTGIRDDEVGKQFGHPTQELAPEVQVVTGRTHGYCNACSGYGDKPNFETHYWLDRNDLKEFADFLAECDGFEIW